MPGKYSREMMCQVTFEHIRYDDVTSTKLTFAVIAAETKLLPRTAVQDALRWYADRKKSFPEAFGKLLCIKAYEYQVHPIDAEGRMPPNTFLPFFEWKCDWPGTVEQYIDMRLPAE